MKKENIGVIGTGMIATSLAVLTTGHGYKTTVFARSTASAARCKDSYDDFMNDMKAHELITSEQIGICEKYLETVYDYADMKDCDVVFECIAEDLEKKHEVYSLLEKNCPHLKAICSVSSSIEADDLCKNAKKYKDRIIVTHPFNPVHMVPYFEICTAAATADGVAQYVAELLERFDRKPVILKKSTPGFIGNRLQFALWREALHIVEQGIADPSDVEKCMMYSFCPRYTSIGMFEHFDNGGLELNYAVSAKLFPELADEKTVSHLVTDKIEKGDLGQKSGRGFYDWTNVDMEAYRERVNAPYLKFCVWDYPKQ